MFLVGPIFLLTICIVAYKWLAGAAYKKGLSEVAFGSLGIVATLLAGLLSYFAGMTLDMSSKDNADISGMFFGGLFFLPMDGLYLSAIFLVIRMCPADAGDMAVAVQEHRTRGDSKLLDANRGAEE